jgi:transmembrane sensor
MTLPNRDTARLAEEAAEWLVRLTFESTQDNRQGLVAWLQRSPRHIEEFLFAQTTFSLLHGMDPSRQIDVQELVATAKNSIVPLRQIGTAAMDESLPAIADPTAKRARFPWKSALAVAASALLLTAILSVTGQLRTDPDHRTYSTALGEQRTIRLSDGSLLELNTRSKATIDFSKATRTIRLAEGEALFVVAHDAQRPFRVSTDNVTIQAVGTQFNVYQAGPATTVTVLEGKVELSTNHSPAMSGSAEPGHSVSTNILLSSGEQANVASGQVRKDARPNAQNAVAWRQRRVVFDHTALSDAVKELERYSDFRIELVGAQLLNRHISGVFQADDPHTIVALLESDNTVTVRHLNNGVIVTPRFE